MVSRNNYKNFINYNKLKPILALTLFTSFNTFATDWATIKKTNKYELLVDMDSYNESAGLPFITTKTIFNIPINRQINGKNLSYIEEHSISQFNCSTHTYKIFESHFFKPKNKLILSGKGMESFKTLEKGSDMASISSLVCQVHQMVSG
jgi:hypothetical protein